MLVFVLLLRSAAGAFSFPSIAATNFNYNLERGMILYKMEAAVDWSEADYVGFQAQVWGYCAKAGTTFGNYTMTKLCEAERKGYTHASSGNCADGGATCSEGTNQNNDPIVGQEDVCEPQCWTTDCAYDKTDCLKDDTTYTGSTFGDGANQNPTSYLNKYDLCSWDRTFGPQDAPASNEETLAHGLVNSLELLSSRFHTKWEYDSSNSVSNEYFVPAFGIEPTYDYEPLDFNMFTTEDEKLWGFKKDFYSSVPIFQDCNDQDEIHAFSVFRNEAGTFTYSTATQIGVFHKSAYNINAPTKFYYNIPKSGSTSTYTWFYMRTSSLNTSPLDFKKNYLSTTTSFTQTFGCLDAALLSQGNTADEIDFRCGNTDDQSPNNNKVCHDDQRTETRARKGTHYNSGNVHCTCGGIQDFLNGHHDAFTATCIYGETRDSISVAFPDGFAKCTLTASAKVDGLCSAGEALVNLDSVGRMDGTTLENLSLENAVIGYVTPEALSIKPTWSQRNISEKAWAFQNPAFSNHRVTLDDVTLLLGCGTISSAPTDFWVVDQDSRPDFNNDMDDGSEKISRLDAAYPEGTHSALNSVHNELRTFSTKCDYRNVLVASVDGHNWEGIAQIVEDGEGNSESGSMAVATTLGAALGAWQLLF